jgi:hypothetical protein
VSAAAYCDRAALSYSALIMHGGTSGSWRGFAQRTRKCP